MKIKAILSTVLLILLSACSTGSTIDTNTENVVGTAVEIADFNLPPGYSTGFSASLLGDNAAGDTPDGTGMLPRPFVEITWHVGAAESNFEIRVFFTLVFTHARG